MGDILNPMASVKKSCPLCGRTGGEHDWDWRHAGTVAVGLIAFGLVLAIAGLLSGAGNLSYAGIAAWMIGAAGVALWLYLRRER